MKAGRCNFIYGGQQLFSQFQLMVEILIFIGRKRVLSTIIIDSPRAASHCIQRSESERSLTPILLYSTAYLII